MNILIKGLSQDTKALWSQAKEAGHAQQDILDSQISDLKIDLAKLKKSKVSKSLIEHNTAKLKSLTTQSKTLALNTATEFLERSIEKQSQILSKNFERSIKALVKKSQGPVNGDVFNALKICAKIANGARRQIEAKEGAVAQDNPHLSFALSNALSQAQALSQAAKALRQMTDIIDRLSPQPSEDFPVDRSYPLTDQRQKFAGQFIKSVSSNLKNLLDLDPVTDMDMVALYLNDAEDLYALSLLILEGNPSKISNHYYAFDSDVSQWLTRGAQDFLEDTIHDKSKYKKSSTTPKR